MIVTTKQLAEKLGVDYVVANNFIKLLIVQGKAKQHSKIRPADRGRSTTVFEITNTTIELEN